MPHDSSRDSVRNVKAEHQQEAKVEPEEGLALGKNSVSQTVHPDHNCRKSLFCLVVEVSKIGFPLPESLKLVCEALVARS